MAFSVKDWVDRPAELDPNIGESVHDWFQRIAAYAAAHPGALTPLNAVGMEDLETRLSDYTDDQVAALATELAALAPINSPNFTGTPTAPTGPDGDDSERIATTAFVAAAIAALGGGGGGGVTALAWTALAYAAVGGNWSAYNPANGYFAPGWAKDDYGIVHLRGAVVAGGAWPLGDTASKVARLPVAARPAKEVRTHAFIQDSDASEWMIDLWISTGGDIELRKVQPWQGGPPPNPRDTGAVAYFDGITYPTVV